MGTFDANGAAPNFAGSVRLDVQPGSAGPPDDSDVLIAASLTDVRCADTGAACGPANTAGGSDYGGELEASALLRLTDRFNDVAAGGGPDPATVVDFPFPVRVGCTPTSSKEIGASCAVATSANAVVPGVVTDGKRAIAQVGQVRVHDGGPDGLVGTAGNEVFAVQGLFVP